ncbi:MAG TPA: cytochrome c3 family protein [Acidobacteriaceae bacterium]|nr:cytochrome c3 family protein [Acidobacteriaceae bacterium]
MKTWRVVSLMIFVILWLQFSGRGGAAALPSSAQASKIPLAQSTSTTVSAPAQTARQALAPLQPIPFSHKQHAGTLNMPCQYCHTTSRSGDAVLIPPATFCMQCHQTIDTTNPDIQKLAAYAKSNTPIPWIRIYELPSFVTFSHRTHLLHGATCQECHGPVAERTQLYKENDISMASCVACHTVKNASTGCNTCHSLNQ